VKIDQYLAKIWTNCNSLLFFGPPCICGIADQLIHEYLYIQYQYIAYISGFFTAQNGTKSGRYTSTYNVVVFAVPWALAVVNTVCLCCSTDLLQGSSQADQLWWEF